MFSDSLSLLPLYVALASQRGAILLPSSRWRKREEREKFVLCLSIFSKGTKGTKGCVEDLPEISRATNVRRRRGTCRVESNPPSVFIFLNKGERGFFFFGTRFVCFIWFDLENIWKYRKCREKVDV